MAFDKDGKLYYRQIFIMTGKRKFTMPIKCIKVKEFILQGKRKQKQKKDCGKGYMR